MDDTKNPYAGYRYPAEIISHAVWRYFRFTLSDRDVEELLAARGIIVSFETVRQWCLKFGQEFANELRRRAPRRGEVASGRGLSQHQRATRLSLTRGGSGRLCARYLGSVAA